MAPFLSQDFMLDIAGARVDNGVVDSEDQKESRCNSEARPQNDEPESSEPETVFGLYWEIDDDGTVITLQLQERVIHPDGSFSIVTPDVTDPPETVDNLKFPETDRDI